MADQSEVDRVLGQYPAQDLDALTNALPPVPPERPFPENLAHMPRGELFGRAHTWLTRNVLEPAQYAMMYPPRVVSRMYPDWPVPAHEQPGRAGLRRRMGEGDKHGGPLPINEIDAMGTYTPGERQSENVEDRRPKSPWEFADGGEVDRILSQYGQGYTSPALNSGDGEIASTPDILAQYGANERMASGVPGWLRRIGAGLRSLAPSQVTTPVNTLTGREPNLRAREDHANPLMLMGGEGANTMAEWVDMHPGVDRGQSRPQDLLAPLGLSAMAPLTAVNNAAGIFGGRLARTADREALSRAEEMAGRGATHNEIWDQTGWFRGLDGKWRFEIDDSQAVYRPGAVDARIREQSGRTTNEIRETGVQAPLYEVLEHPALYDAYSSLAMTPWQALPPSRMASPAGGVWRGETHGMQINNEISPSLPRGRSITLHEAQHGIQDIEGFTPGTNPRVFNPDQLRKADFERRSREISELMEQDPGTAEAFRAYNRRMANMRQQYGSEWSTRATPYQLDLLNQAEAELLRSPIGRQLSDLDWSRATSQSDWNHWMVDAPRDQYHRTAGEVEARNVQRRADFSPEARRTIPPWQSQDVPDADQILRQYSQGPQMSTKGPDDVLNQYGRAPATKGGDGPQTSTPTTPIRAYHGTTGELVGGRFDMEHPRQTGGSFNRHGVSLSPDPRVADRYAMTFGGDAPNVIPADVTLQRPLNLTASQFERLQTLTGKIERREPISELDGLFLEDVLGQTYRQGQHPIDAILSQGYDGIIKDAGRWGIAEPEILALAPNTVRSATTGNTLYSNPAAASLPGTLANQGDPDRE